MPDAAAQIALGLGARAAHDVVRWVIEQSKHYGVGTSSSLLRSFLVRRSRRQVLRDAERWSPTMSAYIALAPETVGMRVDERGGGQLVVTILVVPLAPFGILPESASLRFGLTNGCGFTARTEKTHTFQNPRLMLAPTSTQLVAMFPPGSFDVAATADPAPVPLTLELIGNLHFLGPWPNEHKPSIGFNLMTWCLLYNCESPRRR